VYWKQLRTVADAAKRFYDHVDWSTLPTDWQLYLAGAEVPAPQLPAPTTDPYAMLFVTADAPLEVIRAAYKALAVIFHPDHGGTEQRMTELNNAYTEIRNLREH
jgi:DnaJ-class molecular chaperone